MRDLEQVVRERAYHMWMEAGGPDGKADAFWLAAQREVLTESLASIARVTAPVAAENKRVRKSRAGASSKKRRAA
ncbi:MAG: hypothetical protein JWP25_4521 [Bradyrhizobium sp.]|nr:hypothetical protein [Bradyrhizobium sp.]MEA2866723.1 hypothetical protein [Bradyrhizobium sp.]